MPGRRARAVSTAKRVWPYAVMAWERWQAMPDEQKARYRRNARDFAARGRDYAGRARKRLKR